MKETLREICQVGEPALERMLGEPESFRVEFKTKEDPRVPRLSKADKRNLGKALSGFSNADGGLLIFGIKTKRQNQQDVAESLHPISEIRAFKQEIDGRMPEILRPANSNVESYVIESKSDGTSGYLLIAIHPSDMRPHMSMAPDHQKYFRRSVEGTLAMDHSLVRDMVLAPKQALLDWDWSCEQFMSQGGEPRKFSMGLVFRLTNSGRTMASLPFMKIATDPSISVSNDFLSGADGVHISRHPDGTAVLYASRDRVVHSGDALRFPPLYYNCHINQQEYVSALNAGSWEYCLKSVDLKVGRGLGSVSVSGGETFDALEISVTYGAENMTSRSETTKLDKLTLARGPMLKIARDLGYDEDSLDLLFKSR